MKYSLSFLSICILSFILIYSCSTEEEESVAPVVQTPQLEPETEPVEYTLTVSAAEGGTVSTEGGTYDEGTEVTITATPSEGYRFTGWEGNTSTEESLTITLNSNQTYQALFELIPIYTLTITTGEGGTVSTEGGEYEEGTEVEVTATPNEGYRFDGWEGNDSTNESLTITLNSNQTYQALFQLTNPLAALDVSALEYIESSEDFKFYYNISNNLPAAWIEEFKSIMNYLNNIIPVKSRVSSTPRDGKSEMHIFSWTSIEESPFKETIGDASGACICGNQYGRYMLLEINNNEFIYNHNHRFLVIVHEYFHAFQLNASENETPTKLKFLMEGAAATLESFYSKQYFNENYFISAQSNVTNNAVNSPQLFEERGVTEFNYADSVFIFLSLVKELQIKNGLTQIEALKKVYVEWWQSGREGVNKEILFEEVFGFSLEGFYESLKSYSPDIETVLPSGNITMEEIFEDL